MKPRKLTVDERHELAPEPARRDRPPGGNMRLKEFFERLPRDMWLLIDGKIRRGNGTYPCSLQCPLQVAFPPVGPNGARLHAIRNGMQNAGIGEFQA